MAECDVTASIGQGTPGLSKKLPAGANSEMDPIEMTPGWHLEVELSPGRCQRKGPFTSGLAITAAPISHLNFLE